ncbi:HAD family hydrolase [Thomasclavelia ramosa]|uniref:HAD family hydrolase n=1 Tax=Thomasclavelia ramosa TaxID=1547 RepID=UPI00300DF3D3
MEEEFRYKLIGINANDHYALMKSKFGQDCPAKEIHELSKKLRSDYLYKHGIVIKPGLFELITYLKNKGIKIAVASSSAYSKINEYLALAGLKNIFDLIVGGDDLEHGKPDPEIFLKVLKYFKIAADHALVLEDSTNGILAANAANIPVVCVPDYLPNCKEVLARTSAVLPSLVEVKNEIMKIFEENRVCSFL